MKLSFSLPSKQTSRPSLRASQNFNESGSVKNSEKSTSHEYLTEFDPSKAPTENGHRNRIIPPKQNEWRPEKKMRNLDLPLRDAPMDSQLCFELEAPSLVGVADDSGMSFGLNLRQKSDDIDPNGSQQSAPGVDSLLLQKLKDDLKALPEDPGFEDFDDLPVEDFGAALLAGYGWSEGKGIGRNAKEDVKAFQINRRTAKEGLGFVSNMPDSKHKGQNSTASKDSHQPKWISTGNDVRVVGGKHMGSKAEIIDILGSDPEAPLVALKLLRSGEKVTLHIHEIAELHSEEEKKCLKKLKELDKQDRRHRDERRDSINGHRRGERRDAGVGERRKDKRSEDDGRKVHEAKPDKGPSNKSHKVKENKAAPISWLVSNIRVRIISKGFKGGRLYLKKGEVVDVVGPTTCDITMDDSRELIQGVDQGLLETALPRRGGRVVVLYGKHKGALGSLVEKDLDEETGVVQDVDNHELLKVRLEQIAEYVGDPSYLDY